MTSEKLSFYQKLCFAIGGLPYVMSINSLGLFITPFLLEVAQVRPIQISIILFISRGWDALISPLVGFIVSKTNTRFGRLRPWILFSPPLVIVSYIMIWYVPDITRQLKTIWYVVFFCLFLFFSSCYRIAYTSLTMYLSLNQSERDAATGYRMVFEVTAVLLAALLQGVMITIYGRRYSCDLQFVHNNTDNNSTYSSNQSHVLNNSNPNKLDEGYLITAGILSTIYLLCSCACFFGTKEIHDAIKDKSKNFCSALISVLSHKSYLTLLMAFLFYSVAIQILETNISLYCKYTINGKDIYQFVLIVILVSSIVSVPIIRLLMAKFGKKTTYASGVLIFIPCMVSFMFITKIDWYVYMIASICGISIATNFLLPWSMISDCIDEFSLITGVRNEAIFYSFFVFFNKLSSGISVAITSFILDLVGYVDCPFGCCRQPLRVSNTLRLLVSPGPIAMLLISLIFIKIHSIDEKRQKEIKDGLNNIRENVLLNNSRD